MSEPYVLKGPFDKSGTGVAPDAAYGPSPLTKLLPIIAEMEREEAAWRKFLAPHRPPIRDADDPRWITDLQMTGNATVRKVKP